MGILYNQSNKKLIMRIAVIHLGKKGAGPTYTLEMSRALQSQGVDVDVYLSDTVENKHFYEQSGLKLFCFPTYNSLSEFIFSVLTWYRIQRVINTINNNHYDFVYSTMPHLWDNFIFPRIKNAVRIKTLHDVGVHQGESSLFNKYWNKSQFKLADKYVVLSQQYVPVLERKGIERGNIAVVPHAGFTFYDMHDVSISTAEKPQILFFGRISKYKGIELLLDTLSLIRTVNPDVVLKIVGSGDIVPYKEKLNALKDNVILINDWIKDEDVADYIKDVDFVILPYIHATQSGVIPLAYAFKKPVLATNVGCLSEQVCDGVTGWLVNELTAESIANKAIEMLDDRGKTRVMGEQAYVYMKENLTWESSAIKIIGFLKKDDPKE